jgi:hypothetical protein
MACEIVSQLQHGERQKANVSLQSTDRRSYDSKRRVQCRSKTMPGRKISLFEEEPDCVLNCLILRMGFSVL